jgi:hypothetical protein
MSTINKQKTLWCFGCSFSSPYLSVKENDVYSWLVSSKLNIELMNKSEPGCSNDDILYSLIESLPEIKKNDIVLFQFTSPDRLSFMEYTTTHNVDNFKNGEWGKKNVDSNYIWFNSTQIWQYPNMDSRTYLNNYSKDKLETLISFIHDWQPLRYKIVYDYVINLLNYLKKTKNIKFIVLFLDQSPMVDSISDYHLTLPIKNELDNLSILKFIKENKSTLENDFHPATNGHHQLSGFILNKLNTAQV